MEDVITEAAPPSRLLEEDLNTFTPPSPPLPSPFLIFPHHQQQQPLKPTLLIIAISSSSLSLFHSHLTPQTLTASLILPESNTFLDLHSLSPTSLLAAVRTPIPAHRAVAVAKLLLGDRINPSSVIVLDSLDPRHHRGRLSSDLPIAFKLESSAERAVKEKLLLGELEYYPSGSIVEGFAAAILARCQILNLRASLCVSWPQFDASAVLLVKDLLQRGALRGFDFGLSDDQALKFGRSKDSEFPSHLYI